MCSFSVHISANGEAGPFLQRKHSLTHWFCWSRFRKIETDKNQNAKQKWDAAYDAAAINIKRAETLRDKGHDMQQIMLAAALRRQIAEIHFDAGFHSSRGGQSVEVAGIIDGAGSIIGHTQSTGSNLNFAWFKSAGKRGAMSAT